MGVVVLYVPPRRYFTRGRARIAKVLRIEDDILGILLFLDRHPTGNGYVGVS